MRVYDISQELTTCKVYDGDLAPTLDRVKSIEAGDSYNLSNLSMCLHNGTHVDAPFHFLEKGKTIEQIPLEKLVGYCFLYEYNGVVDDTIARDILKKAKQSDMECAKRILIKGDCIVTLAAANVLKDEIYLIGVESQSVGDENAPKDVHIAFLEKEVVLLEGIRLKDVNEGRYLLNCAPICIKGVDGSPCRALLIED